MSITRQDFASSQSERLTARSMVMGCNGAIAADHYLAATAGYEMISAGGNAIDAGVAAGVAINVLLPDGTSFGGVAPIILYHAATDTVVTLDGLGVWPELADPEEIERRGGDHLTDGILRMVTPGAVDSWLTAVELYGTLSLGEILEPARELARRSPISRRIAAVRKRREPNIDRLDPLAVEIFFPGGRAPIAGEAIVQEDLANTFQQMMDAEVRARRQGSSREQAIRSARDYFYRGPIAEQIASFYESKGGWLRKRDLEGHRVDVSPPLHLSYRGYDVYTCGPWCQGPVLLQCLNTLCGFDLESAGHNTVEYLHLLIEALDLSFSDREHFYGDPRHVDVPMQGLLSAEYGRESAARIALDRSAGRMPDPGNPWRYEPGYEEREVHPVDLNRYLAVTGKPSVNTSYVAAADQYGNVFSATPSDPTFWTPVVPGLGLSCSGRGTQSRVEAGHPSRIMPGARPRLTPNPALVMQGGKPLMGFGCPGGDAQAQGMLQVLLNLIHFGMSPQEAIEAPRVTSRSFPDSFAPHLYYPGRVEAEEDLPEHVRRSLGGLGHDIRVVDKWSSSASSVYLVLVNPVNGTVLAGSDPRSEGSALAW